MNGQAYLIAVLAESQLSSPLTFTAFTETTVPGPAFGRSAVAWVTRSCCASGFDWRSISDDVTGDALFRTRHPGHAGCAARGARYLDVLQSRRTRLDVVRETRRARQDAPGSGGSDPVAEVIARAVTDGSRSIDDSLTCTPRSNLRRAPKCGKCLMVPPTPRPNQ